VKPKQTYLVSEIQVISLIAVATTIKPVCPWQTFVALFDTAHEAGWYPQANHN
jgi:hypothetical protein